MSEVQWIWFLSHICSGAVKLRCPVAESLVINFFKLYGNPKMLNFRIPLCICRRVGCTSRWIMPFSFKHATAEANCLKILRVWKRLISDFENCFHVLMWSGASVRRAIVLISSRTTAFPIRLSKFSCLIDSTVYIKLYSCWWEWIGVDSKLTMVIMFSC